MKMETCPVCLQRTSDFSPCPARKTGFHYECRACARIRSKKRYATLDKSLRWKNPNEVSINRQPLPVRFWSKVEITDSCWIWRGAISGEDGYGRIDGSGIGENSTHRVAWVLANGRQIPLGMLVCHKCDNPPCVNPDHLFVGTHKDNSDDKFRKGRERFATWSLEQRAALGAKRTGERNPSSKLSEWQVLEIRAAEWGPGVCARFAVKFGVAKRTIYGIRSGDAWTAQPVEIPITL